MQEPVEGPESEALRAIDRFVEAFNAEDRDALVASFTPQATISRFNLLVDDFRRASGAAPLYYTWQLDVDWRYEIEVLERVAWGSFVYQLERMAYTSPAGESGHMESTVLYKVRDGRVQSIWQLPVGTYAGSVPSVERPAFAPGDGPSVFIDVAHFNHHKPEMTYWPFVQLLRADGYEVRSWTGVFREAALDSAGVDVLVIANATSEKNAEEQVWSLPTPSAFTSEGVAEVEAWVSHGGSLLLIADHMPWPGAAADLAAAFGAQFNNGIARDTAHPPPDIFRRSDGTIAAHAITDGWTAGDRIDSVATFVGQAFQALDASATTTALEPLLVFRGSAVLVQPEVMGQITDETPRMPVPGWWQGAAATHGDGRVALFGEAAMFRILTQEAGLPPGLQNAQLTRNTIRWLSGR